MRHKAICFVAVIGLALLPASAAFGTPVTVDGDLQDWGVDLALLGDNTFDESSFIPGAGILYTNGNDDSPSGGEMFDAELMLVAVDGDDLWIALVTSANPNGAVWSGGYSGSLFGPGDVKIAVTNEQETETTVFGVGARPVDLLRDPYDPIGGGLSDLRDYVTWDSTDDGTSADGDDTYMHTVQAQVRTGLTSHTAGGSADWRYVDGFPGDAYFVGGEGDDVGYAEAAWDLWDADGDNGFNTWIYEVRVPLDLLIGEDDHYVATVSSFALDCNNDDILVVGEIAIPNGATIIVPEPATAWLLLTGCASLAGAGVVVRRRRSRKGA